MFAHYTLHAKMEASGISSTYPPYSGMLRRPLYWEIRPVRLLLLGLTTMPYTFNLVGTVFC